MKIKSEPDAKRELESIISHLTDIKDDIGHFEKRLDIVTDLDSYSRDIETLSNLLSDFWNV